MLAIQLCRLQAGCSAPATCKWFIPSVRLPVCLLTHASALTSLCRPFVFSNIFQSAPVVASYVANALETGTAWPRVERFFLSCVEADPAVAAMRVEINGRMGEWC
jgi:hypothetical protein